MNFGAAAQSLFQRVGVHTVLVHGNGDVFCPVSAPGLQSAQVGGRLDQNVIAGIDQDFPEQIQRLLGTRGDQDIVRCDLRCHNGPYGE